MRKESLEYRNLKNPKIKALDLILSQTLDAPLQFVIAIHCQKSRGFIVVVYESLKGVVSHLFNREVIFKIGRNQVSCCLLS